MYVPLPPTRIVNKTIHSKSGLEKLNIDCSCNYSVGVEKFSISPVSTIVKIEPNDPHPAIDHSKDEFAPNQKLKTINLDCIATTET